MLMSSGNCASANCYSVSATGSYIPYSSADLIEALVQIHKGFCSFVIQYRCSYTENVPDLCSPYQRQYQLGDYFIICGGKCIVKIYD